jgi:hypothetical protein
VPPRGAAARRAPPCLDPLLSGECTSGVAALVRLAAATLVGLPTYSWTDRHSILAPLLQLRLSRPCIPRPSASHAPCTHAAADPTAAQPTAPQLTHSRRLEGVLPDTLHMMQLTRSQTCPQLPNHRLLTQHQPCCSEHDPTMSAAPPPAHQQRNSTPTRCVPCPAAALVTADPMASTESMCPWPPLRACAHGLH